MVHANILRAALLLCGLVLSVTAGAPNVRHKKRNSSLGSTSNWAGVGLSASPGTYTSVTGTFTVSTPTMSTDGGNQTQTASVWVGIDGATCQTATFQTGLDMNVDVEGNVSYDAWYEWYPDTADGFTGITFKSGDVVTLTVTTTSTTDASVVIENKTSGKTVNKTLSSSSELCMQDANWGTASVQVPFANFGTITFTNASADTSGGRVGPSSSGAQIFVIVNGTETLTRTLVDGSSIQIDYAVTDDPSTSTNAANISASSTLSQNSPSSTIPRTSRTPSASSVSPSPSPSPSASSSSSHSAVIGGVLGGVLGSLLLGICMFFFLRRRERRRRKQEAHPAFLVRGPPSNNTSQGSKSAFIGNGLPMSSRLDAATAAAAYHGPGNQGSVPTTVNPPPQMTERPISGDRRSWIADSTQDPREHPLVYFPSPPEYQSK